MDQGGNKRPGACAIYLQPWHANIIDFLFLGKNTGWENERARDLFYVLWTPELFIKRSLVCPYQSPGLADSLGEKFEKLFEKYEVEGF